MAINPIRLTGRAPKETTMDKILKGVTIAQGIVGTSLGLAKAGQDRKMGKFQMDQAAKAGERAEIGTLLDIAKTTRPMTEKDIDQGIAPIRLPGVVEDRVLREPQISPLQQQTMELNRLKTKRLKQELEPPTESEIDQFTSKFPGQPIPQNKKDLLDFTAKLSAESRREETAKQNMLIRNLTVTMGQERAKEKVEKIKSDRVQKLSKSMSDSGIETLEDKMDIIFEILEKQRQAQGVDSLEKVDIPGFGRATSLVPTRFTSGDANKLRKALASLKNITLKERSGAAVTAPEMARFLEEFGGGAFESDQSLLMGLQGLRRGLLTDKAAIYAGFDDESINTYEQRFSDIVGKITGPTEEDAEGF